MSLRLYKVKSSGENEIEVTNMSDAVVSEKQKEEYAAIVKRVKPKPRLWRNIFWAFVVGGLICTIGQVIYRYFLGMGLSLNEAGAATSATLIFAAAFLTGLGVYDEISRFGGAGGIVPITGFANSMVASALEYRAEGLIFGVGARLFTIAGPVLVWGTMTAWVIGLLYYFFR